MTSLLNNASVLVFLLNKIPYGVVLCNKEYNIVLWNDYAVKLIGESIGKINDEHWRKLNKFYTWEGKELTPDHMALNNAVKNNIETRSKTMVKLDGKEVYVETEACPLYDDEKNIIGGAAFFKEVTNQRQVEKTLAEVLDKLKEMQEYLKQFITVV